MDFEKNKFVFNLGKSLGFLVAYIIFTTIVYFILFFSKKTSLSSSYFYIVLITLVITLIGILLRRWLK